MKKQLNKDLERDLKMIELYESLVEFYKAHDLNGLASHYGWALEVYDRLEDVTEENERLKEQIQEQDRYIEDWQITPRKRAF